MKKRIRLNNTNINEKKLLTKIGENLAVNRIPRRSVELVREDSKQPLLEMAVSLKTYKARVDGLRFQLVENWCLCKWCQLFSPNCEMFNHWITELKACINNLKFLDIKNGIDKRRTLIRLLVNDYDYDDTNMIVRIINDKFDIENISDNNQRVRVASEFADSIQGLIEVIAVDSLSTNNYTQDAFKKIVTSQIGENLAATRIPRRSAEPGCKEEIVPLFEMARVGFIGGEYEVYVWTDDPGNIPHVHIRDTNSKGRDFETCVKLDTNEYFLHGHYKDIMNSSMRKAFNNFMHAPCKNTRYQNNYEFAVDMWNYNNSTTEVTPKYDANGNIIVPDYTKIRQ